MASVTVQSINQPIYLCDVRPPARRLSVTLYCKHRSAAPHPVPCIGVHDSLTFLLHGGAFEVKSSLLILSCPVPSHTAYMAWCRGRVFRFTWQWMLTRRLEEIGREYLARCREGQGCGPKGGGGRVDRSLSPSPFSCCLLCLHEPCTVMCFRCPTLNLRNQALDSGVRGIEWWGKQRARSMSRVASFAITLTHTLYDTPSLNQKEKKIFRYICCFD